MLAKEAEKDQSDKFKESAREAGVELDEEKLKETLRGIVPVRPDSKPDPKQPQ